MHPVRQWLIICVLAGMSGCGTLTGLLGADANSAIDRNAKRLTDNYCAQTLAVREADSRPRVNKAIAPHKIKLDCFGDPDNPLPPAQ